ncbi:trans-sialidase [Trypanosoma cruzi]|nr:trans-sialidase [Trypanosoma cruzi]
MGTMWKEVVRTLPGVWVRSRSGASLDEGLHVGALINATIEGRKVMLYTHKASHPLEASEPNALYLWVTDNNRTLHIGPVSEDSVVNKTFDNTMLYSDGALHLLQAKGVHGKEKAISLARLTEELKTIKSEDLDTVGRLLLRFVHTHGWSGWIPVQYVVRWRHVDRRSPLRECIRDEGSEGQKWVQIHGAWVHGNMAREQPGG